MDKKVKSIYMLGIGGSGMSGIAEILLNLGYEVHGSDLVNSYNVRRLRELGAKIYIGHHVENVKDSSVVVRSAAVAEDNPELMQAREKDIPVISRAEMLAELMRLRKGVAVAGTHGKTTTTSFIATIFDTAKLDPTVVIGGLLNAYGANARLGQGEYIIAEADESDGSFLCLHPIANVVTNIDVDHVDFYESIQSIEDAFVVFMNSIPFYGINIVCGDDYGVKKVLSRVKRQVITYGFGEENLIQAKIIKTGKESIFSVLVSGKHAGEITLNQPGKHNILNALAAIGVALESGIDFEDCRKGLERFKGVGRRFEYKGEKNGITIIDDYGHHPVEIAATLETARNVYPGRRIVVAFQPHRFSRTQALFADFCQILSTTDKLLLTEIYPAQEKPIPGVNSQSLAQGIQQVTATDIVCYPDVDTMLENLSEVLIPGDVLITLGAGNITSVGPRFLS